MENKNLNNSKDYVCSCKLFKKGLAIYCYRHGKENPLTDKQRIKARLKIEKNKVMIKKLKTLQIMQGV